jgi:hypothetical protein
MPPHRTKDKKSSTASDDQKTPVKKPRVGKADGGAVPLQDLHALRNQKVDQHITREKTDTNYNSYIKRGKQFLKDLVTDRHEQGVTSAQGVPTKELEQAFTGLPSKWSYYALNLFITQKCFAENCQQSTADGIHAAFCRYWDEM